jgi:hypothetical protein
MPQGLRVKGQETQITVSGPNGVEVGLDAISSFEAEIQQEILSEGFLGEVAERKDEIFRGCTGNLEAQIATADYLRFVARVNDRATRRSPATEVWNITTTLNLPGGQRARVQFRDVAFGSLPLNIGGRDEYVTVGFDWECSSFRIVL